MKTTIVTTTIHIPRLLREYADNARRFGHGDVDFIVIGDRKSPAETAEFCRELGAVLPCEYLDVAAQQEYLAGRPRLAAHLRFDSIQRRNVGMLWAYERGAEIIITIDDDNFVLDNDFAGQHQTAGKRVTVPGFAGASGWFDVCQALTAEDEVRFYHRGFPWDRRWKEPGAGAAPELTTARVAVNAVLWLDNPDMDALARMHRQPVVRGRRANWPQSFVLRPGTWSPFNSQNTALMREVIPAYFLSPYIGRYDDIWASYVVTAIAHHLGDVIAFGDPLVRQERNEHDLWKDLDAERDGMILTPGLCAALREFPLRGASYHACFGEIAAGLGAAWRAQPNESASQREWRERFLEGLEIWHEAFEAGIGG